MSNIPWISLTVWTPLLAAVALLFIPHKSKNVVRLISVVAATLSLIGAVVIATQYDASVGGYQLRELVPIVPSLGINYDMGVDGWGVSLLLLTGIIIFAGTWATWTLEDRHKDYYILLLALVTGVYGVFVSIDLFVFFLFYELAVLPMYLLIAIWGSSKEVKPAGPFAFAYDYLKVGGKEYAAMKLTLMLLGGSALILAGILFMYWAAGGASFSMEEIAKAEISASAQRWIFPALWIGFGSLGGVFPFHTWSPDGHASAPTATSMLHAGVLMKLGAFGVIRVGMVMLPEGAEAWAFVVGSVAVVNVAYGALCAMRQTDLKYIIAYSSVSHMGIVMLGAATLTVDGWNGAIYQMFAHGIMTGLFFALVGLIYGKTHDREIYNFGGFGKKMPVIAVFFTMACLSSLGMPGMAGFVAEFMVFLGAWSVHPWWAIFGILGAWFTAVYVLRATRAIFWGPEPTDRFTDVGDAEGPEWVALVTLGIALVLFGVWPSLVLDTIDGTTVAYLQEIVGPMIAQVTP